MNMFNMFPSVSECVVTSVHVMIDWRVMKDNGMGYIPTLSEAINPFVQLLLNFKVQAYTYFS